MAVHHFTEQILTDTTLPCRIIHRDLYQIFLVICEDIGILDAIPEMEAEDGSAYLLDQIHDAIDELLSWAECFEKADIGTKHLIVARLVEMVEVSTGYKMTLKFRISLKQFLSQG